MSRRFGACAGLLLILLTVSARAQSNSAPITVEGAKFRVTRLATGGDAFKNRHYVWRTIPAAMEGWAFTELTGGTPAHILVRARGDGWVYAAAAAPLPAAADGSSGWQPVAGLILTYSDSKHSVLQVYRHPCAAGAAIEIPQASWAGGIVLAPEIADAAAPALPADPGGAPPGVILDYQPVTTRAYVGSPAIAILPDGAYVAAHDIFGPGAPRVSTTRLYRSTDRGATWKPLAAVTGQTWSSLFVHGGALYLIGPNRGFGQIVIRRSDDGGRTWTTPIDANSGLLVPESGMHCAPTPVTIWHGRIWRAFEFNPPGTRGRHFQAFLLSAPEDSDLLQASNWTRTTPLSTDSHETGAYWLEGNAVVGPDDALYDVLRIGANGIEKAALLHLSPDQRTLTWDPKRDRLDFPGGGVKFTIRYDPVSRRYWTLVNDQPDRATLRNRLVLTSSADLRHWKVEAPLLENPDPAHHAFQYVDWLIDGDDIVAVSRTSWSGDTGHNANYFTFHRLTNFRSPDRSMQ